MVSKTTYVSWHSDTINKIIQIEKKWMLMSNDGRFEIFHIGNDSKYPIGDWRGGLRVDVEYQPITQWIL